MVGDKSVIVALNECLVYERTAIEGVHDQEHAFERQHYKKLSKWFNARVADARKKRRRLLRRIFELDDIPDLTSELYLVTLDVTAAFKAYLDSANATLDCYIKGIDVAESVKDYATVCVFYKNMKTTSCLIAKTEAKLRQIESIGKPEFLAEKM